jgi:2',3'-cyclic-nucleotide 2'-phosphodiesterase (5'-nucleotidase family)
LAANLKSEKGEDSFLPFHKNSEIVTLPNGIKIGIIGLVTLETLTTTAGFSSKLFPEYQFLPYK